MGNKLHYFSVTLADTDGNQQNKTLSMPQREISAPMINSMLEPLGDFQPAMLVNISYLGRMDSYQFEHGVPRPGKLAKWWLVVLAATLAGIIAGAVINIAPHL